MSADIDTLLSLAREVGAEDCFGNSINNDWEDHYIFSESSLTAFAERIRQDERERAQEEAIGLRENAKVAWRAMCDAEAVIRTVDPESATEGEALRALCNRLTDCAMHLFTMLREPVQEWAIRSSGTSQSNPLRGGQHG